MINKKEVVPPKHKPPTDGPENKNRLKRKLQTVEAELAIKYVRFVISTKENEGYIITAIFFILLNYRTHYDKKTGK